MSEGLVTFFKYKQLGFHKRADEYYEPLDMSQMLDSLHTWFSTRTSLADTLLWDEETPGYSNRKKVYLKSIDKNEETGDFIVILWRAVGNGNGVYGIRSDSDLSDNRLYSADDTLNGENVIWGEPAYYWFIPSIGVFSSIKFHSSISDTELMNRYLRDFMELHSTIKSKRKEVKQGKQGDYLSVSFISSFGDNLWLRIYSEQYTKLTNEADLGRIASQITHFIKRDVISASVQPDQSWTRYFRGLPFISSEVTRDIRKIELTIEASPTEEELRDIFEKYNEEYNVTTTANNNWVNLGFKKEGVGGICWLNQFVIKNTLLVSDINQSDDSGYYTTNRLSRALHLTRDNLLAAFTTTTTDVVDQINA
ncbi:hypothetical protein ACVSUJ_22875 [Yersinia enterocolitica]|uniref:hypothetical protein n=1 Tax=Yersinia enterocolitica TaxID=630 RepID=UPI001C8D6F47|nr:hypothetical protein [Yersinia enterocolitica]MBX9477396.1 hypothetical protein [Yersinia enterocolitica]